MVPAMSHPLSDLEVNHDERNGSLWHIRTHCWITDEYVVVATTRPETMLGDAQWQSIPRRALPQVSRQESHAALMNREIPFVVDELAASSSERACESNAGSRSQRLRMRPAPRLAANRVNGHACAHERKAGPYKGLDRIEARKRNCHDLNISLNREIEPYRYH